MSVWPGSLPQSPLLSGFTETTPNLVLRTQMDAGPPKQRRRFTAGVRPFTISMLMTADQVDIFDDFFMNTCEGGALSFLFPDPRTGSDSSANAYFRFVGQAKYKSVTPELFEVEFNLERMP